MAGLDWAAAIRLLDPQPQHRPEPAAQPAADASRLAGWVARLPEGNRNDGLFWVANRALEAGLTDLGELAEAARSTGLEEREIARTLTSARRRADRPFGAEPAASRTAESADRLQKTGAPDHGTPDRLLRPGPPANPRRRRSDMAVYVREWNHSVPQRAGIAQADQDKEAEAT